MGFLEAMAAQQQREAANMTLSHGVGTSGDKEL